ncbi:MAG: DUF429 domain-containing protein [Halobacteriota archaeon]|nr:DUF429 domain-containing protein [Halobacteriota archaeon]
MIEYSFIQIPGIGEKTEEYLWKKGVLTWTDLQERSRVIGLRGDKKKIIEDYICKAENALNSRDGLFFSNFLSQNSYWRLYKDFVDTTLFLDIETTGLSQYYDEITIIGTFDGRKIKIFMDGYNLKEVLDYLQDYEVVVTFNGKLFDIPFIKKRFPEAKIPPIHIDLRYLLRSLGITGPLKEIEKKLGINRPDHLQEVNGREAVLLWNKFLRGDDHALEKLLLYNIYDVVNLQSIMNECYERKIKEFEIRMNGDPCQQKLIQQKNGDQLNRKLDNFLDISPLFTIPKVVTHRFSDDFLKIFLDDKWILDADRQKIKRVDIDLDRLIKKVRNRNIGPLSVGIDLSGSEERNSGFCILQGNKAHTEVLKTNQEIISKTIKAQPTIISIDSPLGLPKGRDCSDDSCECRKYGITRECERILKKRGINVYPCLIKSMQKLTMRGIGLAKTFEEQGFEVIESYPGAAQDVLQIPRKRVDIEALETGLKDIGLIITSLKEGKIIHDELDALTSALVGYFYLAGDYEALGNEEERYLIIPNLKPMPKFKMADLHLCIGE